MTTFAALLNKLLEEPAGSAASPSVEPIVLRATPLEDAISAFDVRVAAATLTASTLFLTGWSAELGLRAPFTAADLKRAFRRRAFETHPDRAGGSQEAFLRVRAAFDEALLAIQNAAPAPSIAPSSRYVQMPTRVASSTRSVYA